MQRRSETVVTSILILDHFQKVEVIFLSAAGYVLNYYYQVFFFSLRDNRSALSIHAWVE